MNERIKRLAVQAKLHAPIMLQHWGKIDALRGSDQEELQNIEKFTELIVRECVRYFNEDYQRDFDVKWREDLSKGIKQHFGVEQ